MRKVSFKRRDTAARQAVIDRVADMIDGDRDHRWALVTGTAPHGIAVPAARALATRLRHREEPDLDVGWIQGSTWYHQPARITGRPELRAPHHTVSQAAMAGRLVRPRGKPGSATYFQPGELSLAHRGVLLLDELPEFTMGALDVIASVVARGAARFAFGGVADSSRGEIPAAPRFVVATARQCPCGGTTDYRTCECTPEQCERFAARMAPMVDRLGEPLRIRLEVK